MTVGMEHSNDNATVPQCYCRSQCKVQLSERERRNVFHRHAFCASGWPGFTARSRCYIHQVLYPPGVVVYQVVLGSLGFLSSPHIPNMSLFPGLCPCCYCRCSVFVVGLVWFCIVWNFSEVIWGKYLLTSGAKERDDSSQIWLNEIISVNRIVFRRGGNFPSRWRAEVFLCS